MCTSLTILLFALYEAGLTLLYKWVKKESVEMTTWVILGSKVGKLILAAACLMMVRFFTDEPFIRYAFTLLGILIASVVFETAYFLIQGKKVKNSNERN